MNAAPWCACLGIILAHHDREQTLTVGIVTEQVGVHGNVELSPLAMETGKLLIFLVILRTADDYNVVGYTDARFLPSCQPTRFLDLLLAEVIKEDKIAMFPQLLGKTSHLPSVLL